MPFKRLNEFAQEDAKLAISLINMLIKQQQEFIINIENHLKNNAFTEATHTAHGFKGACLNLGLEELAQLCLNIENATKEENTEESKQILNKFNKTFAKMRPQLEELKNSL